MRLPRPLFAALLALGLCASTVLPASAAPLEQDTPPSSGTVNAAANLRSGPATSYPIVGKAQPGQVVNIFDCSPGCEWYQLESGEWIAAFLVDVDQAHSAAVANDATLLVGTWNVESGGADPRVIAARLGEFDGVDLWGLAEVNSAADARTFEAGAEVGENADFTRIFGSTGGGDRLLLLYNEDRFDLVAQGELHEINVRGNVRAPLWAQLRDTASGVELIFMVNHLYRSEDADRHRQATALNDWAETQTLPIIAVGDYNFDWNVRLGEYDHDKGYNNFTADGVWEWVRPATLVSTQDSSYNSVLDFVFTANAAQGWPAASEIVGTPGDFPDDDSTSDHRPVLATFTVGGSAAAATRAQVVLPTPTPLAAAAGARVAVVVAPASPAAPAAAAPTSAPPPPPTATPVPAPPPAAAASAAGSLTIVTVDKRAEYVVIRNGGSAAVDLAGWILRSEKGSQDCPLSGVIQPGQSLTISAMGDVPGFNCGFASTIWNNSESDPAVLLAPGGGESARY